MPDLTDMQLSLLAHEDVAGVALYPMPMGFRLEGAVDTDALAAAFGHVVSRHAALSATYDFADGTACPVPPERLPTLADRTGAGARAEFSRVWHDGFDLEREVPVRGAFARSGGAVDLALGIHHVAGDTWSWDLVLRDLGRAYNTMIGGKPLPAGRPPSPFEVEPTAPAVRADVEWWRETLAGSARTPTDGGASRAYRYEVELDARHTVAVRGTAAAAGVSLAAVLAAAVSRLAEPEASTSTVGLATALRDTPLRRQVVGPLLTILPVVTRWRPSMGAHDVVRHHAEAIGRSLEHREVPYSEIIRAAPGTGFPFEHVVNVVGDPLRLTLRGARATEIPVFPRWAVWPVLWDFSVPAVGNIRGTLTTSEAYRGAVAQDLAKALPAALLDFARAS